MDAQLQQAERLKKDGNTAYAAGRFQAAAKLYLKAVVAAPDEPTYFSNLSAAFFEAGQYKSCVEAIDSAWRLISQSYSDLETDPKTLNLIRKLSMRAVKSLAQCVASQKELPSEDVLSEIEDLRRAIENLTLNNKEDQALAKELRDLWKEWDINGLKDLSKEDRTRDAREQGWKWAGLPRYKPTPQTGPAEFFNVGQDEATSALGPCIPKAHRKDNDRNGRRVQLNKLSREELSSVAVLFGGVGDGRHVYTTIIDLAFQVSNLSNEKQADLHARLTLLDHNPTPLAKDLLILFTLEAAGNLDLTDTLARDELLAIAMYVFVGAAMPPYIHARLSELLDTMQTSLSDPSSRPPWLLISPEHARAIIRVIEYWRTVPTRKSTEEFLKNSVRVSSQAEAIAALATTAGVEPAYAGVGENRLRQDKQSVEELIDQMDERQFNQQFGDKFQTHIPLFQAKNYIKREMLKALENELGGPDGRKIPSGSEFEFEHYSTHKVHVLYPPPSLRSKHPEMKPLFDDCDRLIGILRRQKRHEVSKVKPAVWTKVKEHIYKTWIINPTSFDPNWDDINGGYPISQHNPFQVIQQLMPTESTTSMNDYDRDNYTFMKFPPENQLKSIFEYAAFYFAQVADGLASLRGKLQLEILPAELLEVLERCRYGEKEVKFSRIFTSNIPDYVGHYLPVLTHALTPLKEDSAVISSCYLNTGAFKGPEHMLYNSILLQMKDLTRCMGAYILPDPTPWDYGIASQPLPRELDQLASRNEVNTWLLRIFLKLALPAPSPSAQLRIPQPLCLNAFIKLLQRLYDIGYSPHWLSGVLEDILGDKVVFNGVMPWEGPLPIALPADDPRNKPMATKLKLHLNAYRAELEASLVTASSFLPFAVSASSCGGLPPPGRICKFVANVGKIDEDLFAFYWSIRNKDMSALSGLSACVGLAFGPNEDSLRAVQFLYEWVCGGVEQGKRAADLILVQAVEYNSHKGEATWWMDRNRVAEMTKKKWVMGLARLDCWGLVGTVKKVQPKELESWFS